MEIAYADSALRTRIRSAAEDLQRAQREMHESQEVGSDAGRPSQLLLGAVEALLLAADSLIGERQVRTR